MTLTLLLECIVAGIFLGFFIIGLKEISSWFFKAIECIIFPESYNGGGLDLRDDLKEIMRKYKESKKSKQPSKDQ